MFFSKIELMGSEYIEKIYIVLGKIYGENTSWLFLIYWSCQFVINTMWNFMLGYHFVNVKTTFFQVGWWFHWASHCLFCCCYRYIWRHYLPQKGASSLLSNNSLSHPETMKFQMIAASNKRFPLPFRGDYSLIPLSPWWAWHSRISSLVLSLLMDDHKGVFVILSHLFQQDVSIILFCCLAQAAVSSIAPWIMLFSLCYGA